LTDKKSKEKCKSGRETREICGGKGSGEKVSNSRWRIQEQGKERIEKKRSPRSWARMRATEKGGGLLPLNKKRMKA